MILHRARGSSKFGGVRFVHSFTEGLGRTVRMKASRANETSAGGGGASISDAMPNRFNGYGNWEFFGGIGITPIRSRTKPAIASSDGSGGERIDLGRSMTATVPRMTRNRLKGARKG